MGSVVQSSSPCLSSKIIMNLLTQNYGVVDDDDVKEKRHLRSRRVELATFGLQTVWQNWAIFEILSVTNFGSIVGQIFCNFVSYFEKTLVLSCLGNFWENYWATCISTSGHTGCKWRSTVRQKIEFGPCRISLKKVHVFHWSGVRLIAFTKIRLHGMRDIL